MAAGSALAVATSSLVVLAGPALPGGAAGGAALPAVTAMTAGTAGCADPHVLLLGSYPSEVAANLQREVLAPDQPEVIDGIDFYVGTLEGRHIVTAIAGPSPALTYATTTSGLRHFACTSAVVFTGTAGGGGQSGLGDVTVPGAWTSDYGARFSPVSPAALVVARQVAAEATSQLESSAPVDDGPCLCQGDAHGLEVVPILRTPRVIVGGYGTTYGGDSDACVAAGGMLEGCNPCPPGSGTSALTVRVPVTVGATTSDAEARDLSLMESTGRLVPVLRSVLAHESPPPPTALAEPPGGPTYVADDQQTTAAQEAADASGVPFIAFRGISDTSAVGDLWPFEWLVYQQLAADNAATAARLWIARWGPG